MKKKNSQYLKFILHSSENISSMLFGLVGAAMVARVFGPENMGYLSIVQAVSAIFMALATLGLDHFVVRDFAINKDDGELKGSLIVAQSIGWLLYLASLLIYFTLQDGLAEKFFLIANVALTTYFLRVLFLKLYLQAINDAATIAIAAVVSRVVALIFLAIGTLNHFSFDLMIMYLPIQAFIQVLLMLKGYRRSFAEHPTKVTVSTLRIRKLVRESWPVMFATALYFGYNQADILILSYFVSVKDVGIYASAIRLVPQAVFLGHITVITFYNTLNQHYRSDREAFIQYATKIARIQLALGLSLAFVVSLLSPIIIFILYGNKFAGSSTILAIGVWAWVFMLPAALFSRLLVLTSLAQYDLIKALIVAPVSIGLNILLLPHLGSIAGAFIYVFVFMLGDFLVYAFFKDTRFIFNIGLNAALGLIKNPITAMREAIGIFGHK